MFSDRVINILIVEDDLEDHKVIRSELESLGYLTSNASNLAEAEELFVNEDFQLVLLHLGNEPQESLRYCREFKAMSTVPIIMLTSRAEVLNEADAVAAGADDYVVKPMDIKILMARISHQLIRLDHSGFATQADASTSLVWQELTLHPASHQFLVAGNEVNLTATEYQMMTLFMANPTQIFSRDQLLRHLGLVAGFGADHIVDSHASRIRKKIRESGGPEVIHVVRSVGFRLA